MTIGPGFLQNASNFAAAFSAWSMWQIELGEPLRSEPFDFVEGELRTGGDDEVVVLDRGAVGGFDRVVLRRDLRHRARLEGDAAFGEGRREIDLQGFALSPADRNPRVRRNEMIDRILGDDGQPVLRPHLPFHLVGHDRAAQARAHDDNISHLFSSGSRRTAYRCGSRALLYI